MAPYAWEVEQKNAEKRIAEGKDVVDTKSAGLPGADGQKTGLTGNQAAINPNAAVSSEAAVRTPASSLRSGDPLSDTLETREGSSPAPFEQGDTVRLKGGKGSTMRVDSIGSDGKVQLTVVGKGGTKGGKATHQIDELEPYQE